MQNKFKIDEVFYSYLNETAEKTGLTGFVIEKDYYVTKAIAILSQVKHEMFDLIFQGGTSLSKAHRIVERMSEDCDFRIRYKEPKEKIGKEKKRKALRAFRHDIIEALKQGGFELPEGAVRVRNEGQFMSIRANYPSTFQFVESMKPFIALEFFLAEVKMLPAEKPVTTLIKQVLGEKIMHPEFPVNTVAVIETAAEKWVGLTRRVATSSHRKHYRDPHLVRHLYDLYRINQLGYFTDDFPKLICRIVLDDREQYKNHNDDYYCDPVKEIKRSLDELREAKVWQDNWSEFVDVMVFSEQKPSYHDVLMNLQDKTKLALVDLEKMEFAEMAVH